jgi:hypothetical protein
MSVELINLDEARERILSMEDQEEVTVDDLLAILSVNAANALARSMLTQLLRGLQRKGEGIYTIGRRKKPSRFTRTRNGVSEPPTSDESTDREQEPAQTADVVSLYNTSLRIDEETTVPDNLCVVERVPLRKNLFLQFGLPVDISRKELETLSDFFRKRAEEHSDSEEDLVAFIENGAEKQTLHVEEITGL